MSIPASPPRHQILPAVAVGGACGALARHVLTTAFPASEGDPAWTVVAVNVAGCFLLGLLAGRLEMSPAAPPLLRPFLGVGVLGGFTTFSTFAVDAHLLADAGRSAAALTYVGVTVTGCLLAAVLGLVAGVRSGRSRR